MKKIFVASAMLSLMVLAQNSSLPVNAIDNSVERGGADTFRADIMPDILHLCSPPLKLFCIMGTQYITEFC